MSNLNCTLTVYIVEAGMVDSDGNPCRPGHMFYSIRDEIGNPPRFYGFYPKSSFSWDGDVRKTDGIRFPSPNYQKSFPITKFQYESILKFSEDAYDNNRFGDYNVFTNACIDFTWKAMNKAGIGLNSYLPEGALVPIDNISLVDGAYNHYMSIKDVYTDDYVVRALSAQAAHLAKGETIDADSLVKMNGVEKDSVNPGQVITVPNGVQPEASDQQETDTPTAKIIREVADFNAKFQELRQRNYEIQLGPGNPATIDYEEGEISEEQAAEYELVREKAWESSYIVTVEEMRAYLAKLAFAFSKELGNVEPSLSGGPLYASLASDYQTYSVGAPPASSDPFSMLQIAILGHDNPELANRQWTDIMYKKVFTGLASWGQFTTKVLGPAGVPFDFAFEVEKNKYKNHDKPDYSLTNAILDASITHGIDLGADYSAKGLSNALAKAFDLPDSIRQGLELLLSGGIKIGGEKLADELR